LEEANAQLRYEGSTDPLTGIHNRASFDKRLREEISRAVRYLSPLSFLMIDVDRFKKFNDTFGHQVGDAVLRTVAKSIDYLRPSDFVARYGGEEFAVILPATGRDGALILAERIRARVESIDFEHGPLTVSIGVSTPALRDLEETRLIEAADKALYKAKQMGRNSVIHADSLKVS
jgi:diguanylate cyclase (GGDEF)-like protein